MSRRIALSLKAPARALNHAARHARKTVTMGKRARIGSLTVGKLEIRNPEVCVTGQTMPGGDGLLPTALFPAVYVNPAKGLVRIAKMR